MTVYASTSDYRYLSPNHRAVAHASEGQQKAARSALGNITESAPLDPADVRKTTTRRKNYALTRLSGRILPDGNRVSACMQVPSYGVQHSGGTRGISKNEAGTAHWHGVGHCGSVWSCMVCAQKVAEKRRLEINQAKRAHRAAGGVSILVTNTFPHQVTDKLADILPKFAKALSRYKSRAAFKKIRDEIGYIGQVRALEVTHGANGWHPHVHEVWFIRGCKASEVAHLEERLFKIWRSACVSAGLPAPSREHGLRVDLPPENENDDSLSSYLTKFAYELTYGHEKRARDKASRTPRQILESLSERFTARDSALWQEYSAAFAGRAQLYWSRGLKAHFGIGEVSDSEALEMPETQSVREFTAVEFGAVCTTRTRVTTLEIAERRPDLLNEWVRLLVEYCEATKRIEYASKVDRRRFIERSTAAAMDRLGLL